MIWITLALIALLLDHLLPSCFWERWYYEGFFPILRRGYDAILGWLPIPVIYLLLLWIIWRTIMWFRLRKRRVGYKISKAIGGIAVIVFTFYLFWGYNYHQMPFQERMDFNYAEVDSTAVYKEFLRASDELDSAAAALPVSMTEDQAILAQKF
ncbi:MAG TPA: DUF3810 family protein, partial [Saprospiraceae bacterium]|nr:DUF3810 family protein [Saprospiraceae bacterium]